MGIKQRREREKEEVRQGILTAAREITLSEGWQAVTIRKVAERIEYSPSMIYEYFANKEAILLAILVEGFRLLSLTLRTAKKAAEDQEEQLINMAEAYWDLAMRYPELYQVMHGLNGVPLENCEQSLVHESFDITIEALREWAQSRNIKLAKEEEAVDIIRAFLHGLVCLKMEQRLHGDETSIHHTIRRGMHNLLFAWSQSGGD